MVFHYITVDRCDAKDLDVISECRKDRNRIIRTGITVKYKLSHFLRSFPISPEIRIRSRSQLRKSSTSTSTAT